MAKYKWARRGQMLSAFKNDPDAALDWLANYLPAAQCDAFADAVAPISDDIRVVHLEKAKALIDMYAPDNVKSAVKDSLTTEIARLKPVEIDTGEATRK
jgi:hypothetical protein